MRGRIVIPSQPGGLYCSRHARLLAGGTYAVLPIDEYDDEVVAYYDVGRMNVACGECGSLNFEKEKVGRPLHYNICCHNGKAAEVAPLPEAPELLQELLSSKSKRSRHFQEHIREFNAAVAFVSFGHNYAAPPGHGPQVFRILGGVYHMSSKLLPDKGRDPKYAQLYLYDPAVALGLRATQHPKLDRKILKDLDEMLVNVRNPYLAIYKHMHELSEVLAQDNPRCIKMGFSSSKETDMRRYNHPTAREVAAVFVSQDGAPPSNRDIVVWPREEACFRISEISEYIDPLTYVLLLPSGTPGWHPDLKQREDRRGKVRDRLTTLQFYAPRLMVYNEERRGYGGPQLLPHGAGLLFQQYIVDVYCRAEAQRLFYIRQNQEKLRSESY